MTRGFVEGARHHIRWVCHMAGTLRWKTKQNYYFFSFLHLLSGIPNSWGSKGMRQSPKHLLAWSSFYKKKTPTPQTVVIWYVILCTWVEIAARAKHFLFLIFLPPLWFFFSLFSVLFVFSYSPHWLFITGLTDERVHSMTFLLKWVWPKTASWTH